MSSRDQEIFAAHYALFREYLESYFNQGYSMGPSSAMSRINRLPPEQFLDVSMDVYDELNRRLNDSKDLPFLPIRTDLAPKRNQARQKMATLPENRFKELAAQLYFEIEKRFPNIASDFNARYGALDVEPPRPISNSPSPRETERVISGRRENTERNSRPDRSERPPERPVERSERTRNAAVASEPGARRRRDPSSENRRVPSQRARSRDPNTRPPSYKSEEGNNTAQNTEAMKEEMAKIQSDYEFRIAMLEKKLKEAELSSQDLQTQMSTKNNDSRKYQTEISQLQLQNADLSEDYEKLKLDFGKMQKDYKALDNANLEMEQRLEKLQRDYDLLQEDFDREQQITKDLEIRVRQQDDKYLKLQDDYDDQQRVLENIRNESAALVNDVQVLNQQIESSNSELDALKANKQLLASELSKAESEVGTLKKEVERLQEELKKKNAARTSSSAYQSPIRSASNSPAPLEKPMSPRKEVVTSPKREQITSPTQSDRTEKDVVPTDLLSTFKKISKDLIDSTKNSNPVTVLGPMKSLLLTCKQITQDCEQKEDDPKVSNADKDDLADSKGKLSESLTHLMGIAKEHASGSAKYDTSAEIQGEIEYLTNCVADLLDLLKFVSNAPTPKSNNPVSSQRDTMRQSVAYTNEELPPFELPELKDYLQEQTDIIAHNIQDLLAAIKQNSSTDTVTKFINSIATCMDNIIYETQGTLDISPQMNQDAMADADDILAVLGDIRNELLDLNEMIIKTPSDRAIKQKVGTLSYEVAKQAKDLLVVLDY
ncbi:component of the polarisome [Boothiomyces sp. JEL0866]|nr:component of the polarisome [Boothiomyces sp. JEL0866]